MEDNYIRTKHSEERYYNNALERFLNRSEVSARNKDLVKTYLRESALGMTVRGRAKTKIGFARRVSYLNTLELLIGVMNKNLDAVTLLDMQIFIEALEAGKIKSRKRLIAGKGFFRTGAPLSPRYIVDIKMNIKRYYKYLLGNCRTYPPLVEWIDVSHTPKEIQSLTEEEVQRMIDHARTARDRALVQVLFDGGFRLGELMNVRLQNVVFKEVAEGEKCFFLRAPYSKTIPRTVVLPMPQSTKWLTYWFEEHPAKPVPRQDGVLETDDPSMPLFPMMPARVQNVIAELGAVALGKHVWPHLMRHTSATYWANKLPYFKFCKRFGWTMTSKMPQRYIDATGVDELDTARIYRESTRGEQSKQEGMKQRLLDAVRNALETPA